MDSENATTVAESRQAACPSEPERSMNASAHGDFLYLPVDDSLARSELYLTSIGQADYPPGVPFPAPEHPSEYFFRWEKGRILHDFALVWISNGGGEIEIGSGRRESFHAGCAAILVPGAWHRYRPNRDTGWTESWLCLNGLHLHRLRARGFLPQENVYTDGSHSIPLSATFHRLFHEIKQSAVWNRVHWAALALEMLLRTYDRVRPNQEAPSHSRTLTRNALEEIHQNAHRKLTVEKLAERLGVTRRTLERHFSRSHSRSPQSEIIHVRLSRAVRMLQNPEIPLKEIAYTCGFGSPKMMSHSFRKYLNQSPTEIRHKREGTPNAD